MSAGRPHRSLTPKLTCGHGSDLLFAWASLL